MSDTIDTLELKIASDANKAIKALEGMATALGKVKSSLAGINTGKLSQFSDIKNELKSVTKSIGELQKSASVKIAPKMDASQISETVDKIKERFKDVGKDFSFTGNTDELTKDIQSLSKELDKLFAREDKAITLGKVDTSSFESLQYDIALATNKLDTLKELFDQTNRDMEKPTNISIEGAFSESARSLQDLRDEFESYKNLVESQISSVGKVPSTIFDNLNGALDELRQNFPDATQEIQLFENLLDQVQDYRPFEDIQSGVEVAKVAASGAKQEFSELDKAIKLSSLSAEDFQKRLNALVVPEVNETNLTKLEASLKSVEKQKEQLEYRLEKGLVLGEIVADDENFRKLSVGIHEAELNAEKLRERISQVSDDMARKSAEAARRFEENLKNLQIPEINETNIDKLNDRMDKAKRRYEELRVKLENGITMGRITPSVDDSEFRNLYEQMVMTQKEMSALGERLGEVSANGNSLSLLTLMMDRFRNSTNPVVTGIRAIGNEIKSLPTKGFELVTAGILKLGKAAKSAAKSVGGKLKSALAELFKANAKSNSSFSGGFATILKYAFGIRTLYTLINKLKSATVEGYKNLTAYSAETKQSISSMSAALMTLKNALSVAFAPIVNVVAPYITYFINLMISAANAIGRFFAALTGKSFAVQAITATEGLADGIGGAGKAAKKADKEMNKFIAGWHEVNNMTTSDDSGGGGGGGGGSDLSASEMFTDVPIESAMKDFIDRLKKSWENSDFYWLGTLVGEKIKSGLEQIPWDNIKETASKVGKSFASIINGFVETEGLGTIVGKTIAEAINTGITGLESFASSLHWDSIGTFIADGINGVLENIDWDTAKSAASSFGKGLATLLNNALTTDVFQNIGTTVGEGINTILAFAYNFLTEFKWEEFGSGIAEGINNAIKTINWGNVGNIFGKSLNALFKTFGSFAKKFDWSTFGKSVGTAITHAIQTFDWSGAGSSLSTFVNGLFSALKSFMDKTDFRSLGSGIMTAISSFFSHINWRKIGGTMSSFAISMYNFLAGTIEGVDWKGIPTKVITAISDYFSGMDYASFFGSVGGYIGSAIIGGLDLLSGIGDALALAWDGVVDYFTGYIEDSGGDIAQGLLDGILDGISGIGEWIKKNVFDPFVDGIKEAFGIHSPAKKMKPYGKYILQGIIQGFKDTFDEWTKSLDEWFNQYISPWFTAQKWSELYDTIKTSLKNKWDETVGQWATGISNWWNNNVSPWFQKSKWEGIASGLKEGIKSIWDKTVVQWGTDISNWWNNNVSPWFTVEKWTNVASGIKEGLSSAFESAVEAVKAIWNSFAQWLNSKLEFDIPEIKNPISGETVAGGGTIQLGKLPTFAHGGVLKKGQIGLLEGDGAEAVVPLEKNTEWITKVANEMMGKLGKLNTTLQFPEINFSTPTMDFTPASYDLGSFKTNVQMEMDTKMAELEFENRQMRELLEEILVEVKNKELVVGDKDVFNANRRATIQFGTRTRKDPYPIYGRT